MKVILYRNKEPEAGLDVSKGFKLGFFSDENPYAEFAELEFYLCDEETNKASAPDCAHEWVEGGEQVIEDALICPHCRAVRSR